MFNGYTSMPMPQESPAEIFHTIDTDHFESFFGDLKKSWGKYCSFAHPGCLKKSEFCKLVSDMFKVYNRSFFKTKNSELDLISKLFEIYDKIDFNNTGLIRFDDFVSFLISSGNEGNGVSNFKRYNFKSTMKMIDQESVNKLQYFPGWNKVVMSGRNKKAKIINPQTLESERVISDLDGSVLTTEYIEDKHMLATSSADLCVRFWDVGSHSKINLVSVKDCKKTGSQTVVKYSPFHKRLLTGSRTGKFLIWKWNESLQEETYLRRNKMGRSRKIEKKNTFVTKESKALDGHSNIITDMLIMNKNHRIVSCSLDSVIKIWDSRRQESLGKNQLVKMTELKKHKKGVFSISWSENFSFLVSGGFETEALVWISNIKADPFKLHDQRKPHNTSLVFVKCVPETPQIITADRKGLIKIWDIRTFQCLQSFTYDNTVSKSVFGETGNLKSICYVNKTQQIITAGKRMCVFEYEKTKQPENASDDMLIYACYNPSDFSFLTATKNEVKIWDALTGKCKRYFKELVPKDEITSVCLDETGRRFFVGTHHGVIKAFQYSNGQYIKTFVLYNQEKAEERKEKRSKVMSSINQGKKEIGRKEKEVTSIVYCGEETSKKMIATTWYKGVFVLNDSDPTEGLIHHRFSKKQHLKFHKSDIKCCDYGKGYQTFVTGDESNCCFLWDLQNSTKIAECENGPEGEIICVRMLENYPAFVCSDSFGYLHCWRFKQKINRICSWRNYNEIKKINAIVCSIDFDSTSKFLYTGDENGYICIWDLEKVLYYTTNKSSLNTDKSRTMLEKLTIEKFDTLTNEEVPRQHFWQAHSTPIKILQVINNPTSLLSGSLGSDITIWGLEGSFMCKLKQEQTKSVDEQFEESGFNFPINKEDLDENSPHVKKLDFAKKWVNHKPTDDGEKTLYSFLVKKGRKLREKNKEKNINTIFK